MEGEIFIGLLVLGYVLLTPLILIGVAVRQRNRIKRLEDRLREMEDKGFPAAPSMEAPAAAGMPAPEPDTRTPEGVEDPRGEKPFPGEEAFPAGTAGPSAPRETTPAPMPPARGPEPRQPLLAGARDFLRNLGMWPPAVTGGKDRETLLMQWWLPRVGGLLALLSALFFAVYINQSTSPLFKCMEMVVVSLALFGGGHWISRRHARFGEVLVVTGLVMLYLTSVAAYALPATRVIGNPLTGSVVQAVVLTFICVVGLLRQSNGVVFLAFVFGYLLGIFMAWEGLREGALIAAGLLFLAGALMSRMARLRQLAWLIVPGSFLILPAFAALALVRTVLVPSDLPAQVYLNLLFAGTAFLYLADWFKRGRPGQVLLAVASSLAILGLLAFHRSFYPDTLDWACLVLGLNMLGFATAAWGMRGCGFMAQILLVKASFLIAVWAVLHFAGDLRWMVLGLQTVVLSVAARRSGRVSLEATVWAVAIASFSFYLESFTNLPVSGSLTWWLMAVYPAVLLAAFSFLLKPLDTVAFSLRDASRKWLYGILPFIAIVMWYRLFEASPQRTFDMAVPFLVFVYAGAGLSRLKFIAGWVFALTAALSFVTASLLFSGEPFSLPILSLLLLAAIAGVHKVLQGEGLPAQWAENGLYVLSILPLTLFVLQLMNNWTGQAVVVFVLALLILVLGRLPGLRHLGGWSFLPVVILIVSELGTPTRHPWTYPAVAAGLAWIFLPALERSTGSGLGWARWRSAWSVLGAVIFWLYILSFGDPEASWFGGQLLIGFIAYVLMAGSYRYPVSGYLLGALLFAATAFLRQLAVTLGIDRVHSPWGAEVLWSALLLYGFALLWFYLKPLPFERLPEAWRERFLATSSVLSAGLFFAVSVVTFQYAPLGLYDLYTPILAATAFILILLGLFRVDAVYRRLGLIFLLLPLVRLFVVDVKDVLHRIIAFAAAAVLLTVLGYLYHRLSARLKRA